MENFKIKGIIFDLDGVLLTTDELHYTAWKKLADRLGIYFDREINNKLRGVSRMESLEIVLGDRGGEFTPEEKKALADEKNGTYRTLLSTLTPSAVDEKVRGTIEKLRTRYKVAVGSSSRNTRYILERTELLDMFDAVADGNDIKNSKPDPEVFLVAAERIGLAPAECAVVEDAFAGIDAAVGGGFLPIAIGDATAHKGAKLRLGSLDELVGIFMK